MEDSQAQENKLFKNIKYISETKNDFVYRCPFCGDSTNHNKGHLYISKRKPVFHCFKCNSKGHIYKLEELLNEKINYIYTATEINLFSDINPIEIIESLENPLTNNPNKNKNVDDYLMKRLSLNKITFQNYFEFNIINYELVDYLSSFSSKMDISNRVWFLSLFGNISIGRDTTSNSRLRYLNLSNNFKWKDLIDVDCYTIRNEELKNKNLETLVLAEGIFDIIPIYLNKEKYNLPKKAMYSASLSTAYNRPEKVFRLIHNKRPKNIFIFADTGISKNFILNQFVRKNTNIKLNYPLGTKDWTDLPEIEIQF